MGTSLIQAAAAGVLCIVAIESNDQPTSHGFFHHVGPLVIGEQDGNAPQSSLLDLVQQAIDMCPDSARAAEVDGVNHSKHYDIGAVADRYASFFASLKASHFFRISLADLFVVQLGRLSRRFISLGRRSRFAR